MAKKKIQSIEDALNTFKDVMLRASLTNYLYVNGILLSKNKNGSTIIIVPDKTLWLKIIDDTDLKPNIKELDASNPTEYELFNVIKYVDDLSPDKWLQLNGESIYAGEMVQITISENHKYNIQLNKGLIPLKLKKAEYNNISYRIFTNPYILALHKRFDGPVEDSSFSIIRLFNII